MHPALSGPAPHQHEEKIGFILGQLPKLEPEITQILVKLWKFLSALISPSSSSSM